ILNVAGAYPVLFSLLKDGRRTRAIFLMLFWALSLTVIVIGATIYDPQRAEASILNGVKYWTEMQQWIETGVGTESSPLQFIPQHLLHFVIFFLLSLITASLLSLLMGAILMNYMSFYVGKLISASHDSLVAAIMGWHPWAVLRVISFVILGVALAEPMVGILTGKNFELTESKRLIWIALAGLVLDILLKALLAPWWGMKLRGLL
ncbi:MAG TPA: hypothetical protein VJ521_01630, partial [Acidobacteriota bacterium]|nr:hypothetical protein [Acidobacteriota bacterium]